MKKLLLILLPLASSFGHPLGIFSVNRYTRIELAGEKIRLHYVLDIAEIPSIEEFRSIDKNRDGIADESERREFSLRKGSEIQQKIHLQIGGKDISTRLISSEISFPEGQGGMRTIRVTPVFESQIPERDGLISLTFSDENLAGKMGWKEIVVQPTCGETIQASNVSEKDLTDELTSYPQDRLTDPPQMSEAEVQFVAGSDSASPQASRSIVERTKDGFAELITSKDLSPSVMVVSLLIAMILGAGHALTPGHGKTVVAAYLVGQRGTVRHAAFLGATVTATHTIGVFAMGLITLFASRFIMPEKMYPWLSLVSGLLVVAIGISLARKRIQSARGVSCNGHAHVHSHDASHSHLPPGADGSPVTWKSLLALGVSGGLLPCPSAIVVLLSAIALGRIGFGLLLILAFSAGLAGVLTGIGMLMVYARSLFEKFTGRGPFMRWMPVASAIAVSLAGGAISLNALGQLPLDLGGPLDWRALLNAGSLSVLSLGFVLGLKHALDADHLVAVSTIVSERRGFWSSSLVGALWGLGHTASLLAVGLIVIAFHFTIPEKIAQAMEFSVAAMLVILGANVLWKIRRGATFHVHTHEHQHRLHIHPHLHATAPGPAHEHPEHHAKLGKKPFLIGMVHGMAGSAALMLIVLATIQSKMLALVYIAIFGIGSVGGMFLMSALIGLPFAMTAHHARLHSAIRLTAGLISLGFGLFLAYQIGFVERLLL